MVSVCLPSDALLQHLPSYLGFSYLGRGVSLHGCSSKAQLLLLTLDKGYLLTAALLDLPCGIAPLGPPAPMQPLLLTLDDGYLLTATIPYLHCRIAPLGPPVPAQPLLHGLLLLSAGPGLRHGVAPPSCSLLSYPRQPCSPEPLTQLFLSIRDFLLQQFISLLH